MAAHASGFAMSQCLATLRVACCCFALDASKGSHEGRNLPHFALRHEETGHFGFGDAVTDNPVQITVRRAPGQDRDREVGSLAAVAGRAMASCTTASVEFLSLLDICGTGIWIRLGRRHIHRLLEKEKR